jgi:hypothetical protein
LTVYYECYDLRAISFFEEELEDTKGVIRIRKLI